MVKLGGLPRHPAFPRGEGQTPYRKVPNRNIEAVFLHQLAGSFKAGESAAVALAEFAIAPKKYKDGKWVGGGRGWPGAPYPFLVPFYPESRDGKLDVYRLWDDEWITFHTGGAWNRRATAIGFGGSLNTRHAPKFSANRGRDPSPQQFEAGKELVMDYLLPRFELGEDAVMGHFDAGKPTCPGDVLEAWIRTLRGETVAWLSPGRAPWDTRDPDIHGTDPKVDRRPLDTWKQRQEALVELGYDVGRWGADGVFGYFTRMAVEAFQADAGIIVDGIYGEQTERHLRIALAANSS